MIVNNLKQIDLAKQGWAFDHSITGAVQVTEQDLAAYFPHREGSNGLVIPVAGEQYAINLLGASPEARLTRGFGRFPKGALIRLGAGGLGYETIPPNLAVRRAGANPSAEVTNHLPPTAGSRR